MASADLFANISNHNTPMWPCDFFAEIHFLENPKKKPVVPLFWGRGPKGQSQNLSQAGAQSDGHSSYAT